MLSLDDAVILAGGRSSRMGRDKALLPFGGYSTLTEYQYRRLQKLFARVFISSKEKKFPFQAPIIEDRGELHSPLVALYTLLKHLDSKAIFILGVDLPFVDEAVINALKEYYQHYSDAEAIIAKSPRGYEPLCGIYTQALLTKIKSRLRANNHRLQDLLKESKTISCPFSDTKAFLNLNREDDYRQALKRLSEKSTL